MRFSLRISVGLLALAASTPVQARADAQGKFAILGEGTVSCGTWTENHKDDSPPVVSLAENAWVLGFVSAYNLYGPSTGDITGNTDNNGLVAFITNYCGQHPLDQAASAAQQLIIELKARPK